MEEILFEHPTDTEIWHSSYRTAGRAAYMRAYQAQCRRFRADEQREANTAVGHEPRRSDRFNPGESGVPPSLNRLAEENRRATEARAKELYRQIVLHRKAGIPVNHDVAEFMNLLGYRVGTAQAGVDYMNSPECAQRFGAQE